MKHVLLLGASFGTGNLGVSALAAGAITVVRRRLPGARVAILDYGRESIAATTPIGGVDVPVDGINLRFSWKILLPNNVATLILLALVARLLPAGARAALLRRNRWLAAICAADVAVAVSGGDSFADLYGLPRLAYVGLPQLLALAAGVPLVQLPQTVGPLKRASARAFARLLLRRSARIFTRDPDGLEAIRALVGPDVADRVRFCPDLAFVLEPKRPADEPAVEAPFGRPLVGLNISGLLAIGGYTKQNMFSLQGDHAALVDRLVAWFVDVAGADVVLVPHVCAGEESDAIAAQAVHARLPAARRAHVRIARADGSANEIKWVIGRCEFFVGARMHACIGALSQAVPAIGLAYSDKFTGVFGSVGVPELVADQRRLSGDETLALVAWAFERRADFRAGLLARVPAVRDRVLAVLDDVGLRAGSPVADVGIAVRGEEASS